MRRSRSRYKKNGEKTLLERLFSPLMQSCFAERQGFEPWEQLPVHRISSAARLFCLSVSYRILSKVSLNYKFCYLQIQYKDINYYWRIISELIFISILLLPFKSLQTLIHEKKMKPMFCVVSEYYAGFNDKIDNIPGRA